MKKVTKNRSIIQSLVVLILILGFFYFFDGLPIDKRPESNSFGGGVVNVGGNADIPARQINYDEEFKRWRKAIKNLGPAEAYREFKQTFAQDHFGTQHAAAHIFGEVLFDEEGIEGLAYCDNTFAFGCFHSFFGKALYILGEDVIDDMDRACLKKYGELGTGCQHGIGHGLLQYTGYNSLEEALELCKHTTQKIPIFGCTSGVFMEYNVPLVGSGKDSSFGTRSRELNKNKPYEPCDGLPKKFQESCYYEMGQWWDKVYLSDYKKMGELCENIPNQEFRSSCYLGVGNVVVPTNNYLVSKAKAQCSLMPNRAGEKKCLAGASWSFFANPDYRELAPQACEGLKELERLECAKDADLTRSLNL